MFEEITVPSRLTRPDQFAEEAELAFNGIAKFIQDYNYLGSVLNGAITSTSTTSLAIGTGTKSLTVQAGLNLVPGYPIRLAYTTDPTKYMDGQVTTYNSTTGALVANILSVNGSGTFADWQIMVLPAAGDYAGKGANTFTGPQTVPNDDYDESTWNGNNSVPTKNAVRDKIQSVASTFVGASKNLIVTNDASTPNSRIVITADEVLLKNSSGDSILVRNVSVTVDITSSGVNGIDTGSEEVSTDYYLHLMYNPTTATTSGTISKSATTPTLQSGYSYSSGKLAWVYNDASSNFIKVYWVGRKLHVTSTLLTTTLPTGSYVAVSTVGVLPPQAKITKLNCFTYNSSSGTNRLWISPGNSDDFSYSAIHTSGSGSATGATHNVDALTITANTVYYKRTGTDPLASFEMRCSGGEW